MKHIQAKSCEKNQEIRAREREEKILSRTLGRAEAIITQTSLIKRPKRVVIVEDEIVQIHSDTEKSKKFIPSNVRKIDSLYYKGIKKVAYAPYFGDQKEGEEDEKEGEDEEDEDEDEGSVDGEEEEEDEEEREGEEEGDEEKGEGKEEEDEEKGKGEEGEEEGEGEEEEKKGEGEEGDEEREDEEDDEESSQMTMSDNQNSFDIEKCLQSITSSLKDNLSNPDKYGHSSKDFTNDINYSNYIVIVNEDQVYKYFSTGDDEHFDNGQLPHTSKARNTRNSSQPSVSTETEFENKDNTSSTDK